MLIWCETRNSKTIVSEHKTFGSHKSSQWSHLSGEDAAIFVQH